VLKRAKVHVENVGGKVWGVVLNDVKTEIAGYAYTQYYTHYYGEETVVDARKERLQQVQSFLGRLFRRAGRADAAAMSIDRVGAAAPGAAVVASPTVEEALAEEVPEVARTAGWGAWMPKRLWLALLVVALVGVLGALAGWRLGWFGGAPRPKELLRQRLEAPPTPPGDAASPRAATPLVPPVALAPQTPAPPLEAPAAIPPGAAGATVVVEPPVVAAPPAVAASPTPARPAPAISGSAGPAPVARFAIEFGPFMTAPEAERVERQLNEAGYQTVRFRQQTGAALYAVLIEKVPSARDAQALIAALREQGFGGAFVVGEREPLSVQVGLPLPLRGAVQTAERLRASGHAVRIAVQPGEAVTFAIRHGNFVTQKEAETKGQELVRLGLVNQVVRVK
jgi:hypothetical protein